MAKAPHFQMPPRRRKLRPGQARRRPMTSSRQSKLTRHNVLEPPIGIEPMTSALREPLPVLTLALTRHVGCTAGIYRRLWPLQMTPVRTTNGATPTSSRARQRRRGSSAKPGAIADIDPRPRLPAETRSDGARSEVRAGDGMRGSNACVDRTLARQRVVSTLCTQGLSTAAHSSCAERSSSGGT
jgi:hypothetical protein